MASDIAKEIAKTVTVSNYNRALLHRGSIRTQDVEIWRGRGLCPCSRARVFGGAA